VFVFAGARVVAQAVQRQRTVLFDQPRRSRGVSSNLLLFDLVFKSMRPVFVLSLFCNVLFVLVFVVLVLVLIVLFVLFFNLF
jgi:hypothetical protein